MIDIWVADADAGGAVPATTASETITATPAASALISAENVRA
jgi:hypothetical protein